jgi:tetratricopeptide (TPR) repeat protein
LQTRAGAHPDDPGLGLSAAIAQGNLGEFLVQQGEANDAIVELNKAVMSLTSLAENQPPDSKPRGTLALALFSLGEAERQAGARSEARAAFSRGVELGAAFIAAAPNIYFAHYQEASALYELSLVSDPPEARDALLRAIQILDDMTQRGVKDADVGVARKFLQTELDKAG